MVQDTQPLAGEQQTLSRDCSATKYTFETAELFQQYFSCRSLHGVTLVKSINEVEEKLTGIFIQESTEFTVSGADEKEALSCVRMMMQIQLENFIVAGLVNRDDPPSTGKFCVADPIFIFGPDMIQVENCVYVQSPDLRIRDKPQWHNGGYLWFENNGFHMGFKQ